MNAFHVVIGRMIVMLYETVTIIRFNKLNINTIIVNIRVSTKSSDAALCWLKMSDNFFHNRGTITLRPILDILIKVKVTQHTVRHLHT
ncbi:hypothetical protein MAR_028498 [Mya arenaria]|uniref:Secreted protein n=1 Tax=Mya arenaria TaxID=6604 RepID=A0ABY7DEU9_MYAAR|nr:hypothetical protein MAR_028498 [Mya arenaria]